MPLCTLNDITVTGYVFFAVSSTRKTYSQEPQHVNTDKAFQVQYFERYCMICLAQIPLTGLGPRNCHV